MITTTNRIPEIPRIPRIRRIRRITSVTRITMITMTTRTTRIPRITRYLGGTPTNAYDLQRMHYEVITLVARLSYEN